MRTFLFLTTKTTGLDTEKDRILQLSTRLVVHKETQDSSLLIRPSGFAIPAAAIKVHDISDRVATTQGVGIGQALELLMKQLRQAEIIIGHNIAYDIEILLAQARRVGRQDIIELLTPPLFGFNGGTCAAVCIQRLAADYLRHLGEPASLSDTKLTIVYQKLFGEELVGAHDALADAIACQRIYEFLSTFQLEQGVEFLSDIVCFED
jgi:DNA polymerase III epsilon subunit-like protein